jgi:CHAT domain-containing protein
LAARLHVAEAKLRASSPRYVDLVEPLPVAASELQQRLLDSDTVLLEFVLGDAQSWLWAITQGTFDSYKLPPRAEIDAAARRMYDLLTARQPARGPRPAPHGARIADADAQLSVAEARLSRLLLASIEPRLRKAWRGKRLVIVASGSLEYVPFGVLPLSSGHRLLADHEVVNLPSATVLAALRREASQRPPPRRTLALIADPVFDPSDPRVQQPAMRISNRASNSMTVAAADRPAASEAALRRAASGFTRGGFARLPFSREEVSAIAELVPRNSVLQATDFQASRALVVGDQLSQYRFVHFATHGILNSRHPELSGLVLSLVDEKGRPQNGFLRLQEIYDLRLGADVVVLSACQTALGKEIKGEGLVGLTRGFMYAGAQRIVASLWQVDDLATSQLMKAFYRGMLKDGLRPAAALRAAQLDMMTQERWAAPYYWAAFTLQGDWR